MTLGIIISKKNSIEVFILLIAMAIEVITLKRSVVKSTWVPNTMLGRQLITTCNSSSSGSDVISWLLKTFGVMGKCSHTETHTHITPLINRLSLVLFAQLQKDALCSEEGQAAKLAEEEKSRVIKPLRRESRIPRTGIIL